MFRPLMVLTVVLAAPAVAQDPPSAAIKTAMTGTWQFDVARSDTMPPNPLMIIPTGSGPRTPTGGGGGGGGRGGRGGGRGGGAMADAPSSTATGGGAMGNRTSGRGGNDQRMKDLLDEIRLLKQISITVDDAAVTITNPLGDAVEWRTDGRKHQEAQMVGGIVERQAKWRGKVLQLDRIIPDITTELRREFEVSEDGKTLELRLWLGTGGRKGDRKLVFEKVG